jgi:hypothetical protein
MKKTLLMAIIISALLTSILAGAQAANSAMANPLSPPLIRVYSPQNNKIYSSNEVQLNFTIIPNTGVNLTSFSYSLDGQTTKATNGSTILTGLSAGSHTLIIYGNWSYPFQVYNNNLETIYFSTIYSPPLVTFTIILLAAIAIILLIFFKKRKQLIATLKRRKTASFWVGLACFLFFAILFFVPGVWHFVNDYLFSHFLKGESDGPLFGAIIGLFFMGVGWYLMRQGIKKQQNAERK